MRDRIYKILGVMLTLARQGGRGHWAVYHTSPQSFIMFSYSLVNKLWRLL